MTRCLTASPKRLQGMLLIMLLALGVVGQNGCTKSIRQDATRVAQAGSATAKQLADYYDSLAQDNIRAWELNSFFTQLDEVEVAEKSGRTPKAVDMSAEFTAYRKRQDALVARKQMAVQIQGVYDAFTNLASYDAAGDVSSKLGDLSNSVQGLLSNPLPQGDLITAAVQDIVSEIEKARQNKAIIRESRGVILILENLLKIFKAEKNVYKSIPTLRATWGTQLAKKLVENQSVISTALVNDALARYDLKWPEPQTAFKDDALIAGIKGMIDARAKPLEKISQDVADKIDDGLTKLIALHKQLEVHQPLSFAEWADASATVQVLLAQLKEKNIPADDILNVVKSILKEE